MSLFAELIELSTIFLILFGKKRDTESEILLEKLLILGDIFTDGGEEIILIEEVVVRLDDKRKTFVEFFQQVETNHFLLFFDDF